MRYYPFADNRRNKIIFGIFLTAMLYLARDTLLTSSILGFQKAQFLMAGLMGLAGVVFLIHNRRSFRDIVKDERVAYLLVATAVMQLPMMGKQDWQIMYFSVLLCLYFAIFLTYFVSSRDVAKYYVVILAAMGLYSIIATYFLRLLPDRGLAEVPIFLNPVQVQFYNFGLSYVSIWYVPMRNFGIFREPGVYQYFIMLALFLNNYAVTWNSQKKLWLLNGILAAMMISTMATGGYVELLLFALVLFIDKKLYRNKIAWLVVGLAAAGAAGVLIYAYQTQDENPLYWEIYGMVVSKIFGGEDSSTERVASILINLKYFLKNPLFGGKLAEVLYSVGNNTSSTTLMFAIFGLFGGCIHVAGWVALVWEKGRKLWVNLMLLLILFMSFNTQNLIADVFLWLLPTMALTEKMIEKKVQHGTAAAA